MHSDTSEIQYEFGQVIARNRRWYIAQGILFLAMGVLALFVPAATVIGVEIFLAALLMVTGGYQAYHGIKDRSGWLVASGLLSLALSVLLILMPLAGAVALATFIALFLLAEGIVEVLFSLQIRFSSGWKWLLISGVLSVALGVLLLVGWPDQTLIMAGILLGINFIFYGASILFLAFAKPNH